MTRTRITRINKIFLTSISLNLDLFLDLILKGTYDVIVCDTVHLKICMSNIHF